MEIKKKYIYWVAYGISCMILGRFAREFCIECTTMSQVRPGLFYLYEAILMDLSILEKTKTVNVSSFSNQYDIIRMMITFGFEYDVCKTLYQYHMYHNVKLGSTFILIETTQMLDDLSIDTLTEKKKITTPTGYKLETVIFLIFATACIVYRLAVIVDGF